MQRNWLVTVPFVRVYRPESSRTHIQVPGTVVVEVKVGVELFAGEEVVVRCYRCARERGVDEVTEGVVVVGIGDCASGVGEGAHAAVAVEDVVACGWRGVDRLMLADEFQAPGVGARNRAALYFVQHLRIAGGIEGVDEVLRRAASAGLGHAVAVTVVNDAQAGLLDQMILEIVGVPQPVRGRGVAVRVVGIGAELVVSVVVRQPAGIPRHCRNLLRAVAHRVAGTGVGGCGES